MVYVRINENRGTGGELGVPEEYLCSISAVFVLDTKSSIAGDGTSLFALEKQVR